MKENSWDKEQEKRSWYCWSSCWWNLRACEWTILSEHWVKTLLSQWKVLRDKIRETNSNDINKINGIVSFISKQDLDLPEMSIPCFHNKCLVLHLQVVHRPPIFQVDKKLHLLANVYNANKVLVNTKNI